MQDFWCKDPKDMHYPELAAENRRLKETEEGAKQMESVVDRIFVEGRAEGRKEGREEMRETGIKALVVTLKRLSQTLDLVIQTVAEQFDLSLEEAEEKTKQYWYK